MTKLNNLASEYQKKWFYSGSFLRINAGREVINCARSIIQIYALMLGDKNTLFLVIFSSFYYIWWRNKWGQRVGVGQNVPIVFLRVVWDDSKGVPMAARLQRGTTSASCVCNLYRDAGPKRCHNSQTSSATQPLLHMVQHIADCVVLFPRSQYSPPPSP